MHPPDGFEPFSASPFFEAMGPVYVRWDAPTPTLGLTVAVQHTNRAGTAHGGLLAALADVVLGQGIRAGSSDRLTLVTAGLTIDFARAVRLGAWVDGQADVQRRTDRTVFASCHLVSGGERCVRASGIYTVLDTAAAT